MNLIIDLGNTKVKYAVFDEASRIVYDGKLLKRYNSSVLSKIPKKFAIRNAILCNTSEPHINLMNGLKAYNTFIHFDVNTPIPVKNKYQTPHTLGKDRLAAAVASVKKYPATNILFIDLGTCITTNFVNANSEFIGGNISPGINMRLRAMHHFTAKLPLVNMSLITEDFGTTTVKALQNGAVKGAFREIDALIGDINAKFGSIKVILTGGDAIFFESWTKKEIFVSPNLVMEGLNEILKYNVDKK